MSVLGKIKDFLFGKKFISVGKSDDKPAQTTAAAQAPVPTAVPETPAAPQPQQPPHQRVEPIDIEAVLDQEAAAAGQPLNWRTSIVDLMKLCDIDPSLENRRDLADELGYTGNKADTVSMNIWLHTQVLRKLEESGGKVPADLKD